MRNNYTDLTGQLVYKWSYVKINTFLSSVKLLIFSYPSISTRVLGAQKNRLDETVLLSTQSICFVGGSVVECLTRDRGAAGWSLTSIIVLYP